MQDKIMNAFKEADNQFQGIAFIIGGDAGGATDDVINMTNLFRKDLKFATYSAESSSKADMVNLISAAAKFEYPLFCEYIAFYYSGHGGIENDKPFLLPKFANQDKVFIEDNILQLFKSRDDNVLLKGGNKRKCLFFFDCCLSLDEVNETTSISDRIQHFVNIGPNNVVAYATGIGSGAQGERHEGGEWTKHLSKCLKEEKSLHDALLDSCEAVINELKKSNENSEQQKPFHVGRPTAEKIHLTKKLPILTTASDSDELDTKQIEMRSHTNPEIKGVLSCGGYKIKHAEWNKRFERAQVCETQTNCIHQCMCSIYIPHAIWMGTACVCQYPFPIVFHK